ncbi:MAG: hypothetical protein FJ098_05230 [Deltaproteobacteria bacterium]|nr:hypothetical protein [Deltaproteobacteria bacterium]
MAGHGAAWVLAALVALAACGSSGGGPPGPALGDAWEKEVAYNPKDAGWGVLDADQEDGGPADLAGAPDASVDLLPDEAALPDLPAPPDGAPGPDTSPPLPDGDLDGIPDAFDPFPGDGDRPGTGSAMSVYMHTADTLWKLDVKSYAITEIGDFQWPWDWADHRMTDIAMDRFGVLYGVSFDTFYTCHPQTAECWTLGDLPENFNGLTLIPEGTLEPDQDVLIGISGGGGWYRLELQGGSLTASKLGEFGGPYTSSGDAYSIAGAGTFAAANKAGQADDVLVALDPATGQVLEEIGTLSGYDDVYGLAGWTGKAFAFDEGGAVLIVDTATGAVVQVIEETSEPWWGAGVRTLIF